MKYLKFFESYSDKEEEFEKRLSGVVDGDLNGKTVVANIRMSDEQTELRPLAKFGVKYVQRFGDTKRAYYELDYNYKSHDGKYFIEEYGYAPLGKQLLDKDFEGNWNITYIDSPYYEKDK